jgi:hypothetical protein
VHGVVQPRIINRHERQQNADAGAITPVMSFIKMQSAFISAAWNLLLPRGAQAARR